MSKLDKIRKSNRFWIGVATVGFVVLAVILWTVVLSEGRTVTLKTGTDVTGADDAGGAGANGTNATGDGADATGSDGASGADGTGNSSGTRVRKIDSLTCKSSGQYPFFRYDEASSRDLKLVFSVEGDQLRSVALQYMLYYNDGETITQSEAVNHAAMNEQFYQKGLGSDAVGATFAKLSDALRFSLYQTAEKLVESEKSFLLLDGVSDFSMEGLQKHFEDMGFACTNTR